LEERLEAQIRKLQEFYWSDSDPDGRGFVPLADMYRRAGDYPEARRLLKDGLGRHPKLVSGHVVLGWVLRDQGDSSEAEASFRAALALDPKNLYSLKGLGELLLERSEWDEALRIFQELLILDPMDEEVPVRIPELQEALEPPVQEPEVVAEEEAPPEPEAAVWEDQDGVADDLDWGSASVQQDESGYVEDEVEVAPEPIDDALATRTMGEIYLRQGLLDQAREVFQRLLEKDPESQELQSLLEGVEARLRGEEPEPAPEVVIPIGDLAPDEPEAVPVAELAPEVVIPIGELAPDEPEAVPVAELAPEVVIPIGDLAPDEPEAVPVAELVPEVVIPIGELAPDEPEAVPVAELAPDEPPEDPTLDAFDAWLEKLK